MAKLLSIVADPKEGGRSVSKKLLDSFLTTYRKKNPKDQIETLDLYKENVPNLTDEYIQVVYEGKNENQASKETRAILNQAHAFIDKLIAADTIVVVVPMWNFNVPAVFKSFIDLVIYPKKTFAFSGPGQYQGLLKGKKLICLGARGGMYSQEPYIAYDHQDPWLKGIFGFMGITDAKSVWAEGTNLFQGDDREKAISDAMNKATVLAG